MGDGLGLVFGLGIDPSGVKPGLDQLQAELSGYEKSLGDATAQVNAGLEQTDKALLGNRESVRLLMADMGIHLPRAVTSAIGQMLPEIASVGTALLGIFALEEAEKFVGWIKKCADNFNEVAESEKLVKAASDENLRVMETMAKKSKEYAVSQIALLNLQMLAGQIQVDTLKDQAEGLDQTNPIIRESTLLWHFLTGETKEQIKAQAGLNEVTKMHDELVNILGEDEDKAHKAAFKAVKEEATEWERSTETQYEYWRRQREAKGHADKEAAHEKEELAKVDERHIELLREEETWRIRVEGQTEKGNNLVQQEIALQQKHAALMRDALLGDQEAAAELAKGINQRELSNRLLEMTKHKQLEARKAEHKAAQEALNAELAGMGALAEGTASLIGSKKGYYAIKAAEEVAAGLECIAESTWPPNPLAAIAAGIHFESATDYAKIAGTSASRHGGGGSAGAGTASSSGGGGSSERGGGEPSRQYPGAGPQSERAATTIHLNWMGPGVPCDNCMQRIVSMISQGVKGGTITGMVANEAMAVNPR